MAKALEMVDISKAFDGRLALSGASLDVAWGEVHALLGQNGAGKSTLMNVACGLYSADGGAISVDGSSTAIRGPADAARLGIGMVHQHFKLVRRFTVAENILLACGRKLGIRTQAAAAESVRRKATEIGLTISPATLVAELSLAEQQRIEILKMLLLGARILVLDEPTAVLTDQESESVLTFLGKMAAQGAAVILITHKLREVSGHADRVTVMRDGKTICRGGNTEGMERADLARLMVGEMPEPPAPFRGEIGAARLEARNLAVARDKEGRGFDDVSLTVRAGEILGLAGVGGNGQSELVEVLTGIKQPLRGTIRIDDRDVAGRAVPVYRRHGVRTIPADRYRTGLLADLMVYENYGVTGVREGRFGGWIKLARKRMRSAAAAAIDRHQILGCSPTTVTRLLSGGNAQKLLLARELGKGMSVLIAHSPTRGLDVQASQAVHRLLQEAARTGAACLLVSEDLEEILALSTRIAVMSRGRIVGEVPAGPGARQQIGSLMLGHA